MMTDEKVPTELKKAIMQGRMDKKLTQAQLAQVFIWILNGISSSSSSSKVGCI